MVLKMVDYGMPLAHTLFLSITYCACSVIGVPVIRLITLGYFTFLFKVQHSRFLCVIIIIETGLQTGLQVMSQD